MTDNEILEIIAEAQITIKKLSNRSVVVTEEEDGISLRFDGSFELAKVKSTVEAAILLQSICLFIRETKLETIEQLSRRAPKFYISIPIK